jgi:hypothetical protein
MESSRGFKNCQSCGMPLKRDEKGGGTNADGTKSTMYCSHCFQAGHFTMPDLTVEQMKERVKGKLKEFGFPGFVAGFFTRRIPMLERWK